APAPAPGGGGGGGDGGDIPAPAPAGDIHISTSLDSTLVASGEEDDLISPAGAITVRATLEEDENGRQLIALDVTAGDVSVPRVSGGVRVNISYAGGSFNTVAALQESGGSQTILPKSIAMDGEMLVHLNGPAELVLLDNPKDFLDTQGHWGRDGIDFATSHELFQGVGNGIFDPNGTMTRAMLWTVLARLELQETDGGSLWYEKGMEWAMENDISDGTCPEEPITREQLAVMLWRIAGSPVPAGGLERFGDAEDAADYALQALAWAVETEILTGKGDGVLDPGGSATRVETALMLMRFILVL
ncbi:MAG: S-layer homology domain-containing protein, partial [Bacillota bacterium]|nr:S-layer homology domain-containing protein [Bacillota bacterium]